MQNVRFIYFKRTGFLGRLLNWVTDREVNSVRIVFDSDDWCSTLELVATPVGVVFKIFRASKWYYEITATKDISNCLEIARYVFEGKYWSSGLPWWKEYLRYSLRFIAAKFRHPTVSGYSKFNSEIITEIMKSMFPIEFSKRSFVHPSELLNSQQFHLNYFTWVKRV